MSQDRRQFCRFKHQRPFIWKVNIYSLMLPDFVVFAVLNEHCLKEGLDLQVQYVGLQILTGQFQVAAAI
jgi:hypothetical protein